jgi:hypothetical protein
VLEAVVIDLTGSDNEVGAPSSLRATAIED